MHRLKPQHIVKDFQSDPEGNVIVIDPQEDFPEWVPSEDNFSIGDKVLLEIPAADNSQWEAFGTIIDMDLDEGYEYVLLLVRIDWNSAAPLHESSQ